jgi:hypothetical protein
MPSEPSAGLPISGGGAMRETQSHESMGRIVNRLERVRFVVHIVYWWVVGCALILIPWFPLWDHNHLLYQFPSLRPIVSSPFTKGAVLGLGIVNLVIGTREIANFRKGLGCPLSR